MDPLNDDARDMLQRYRASISPDSTEACAAWTAITERMQDVPAESASMSRLRRHPVRMAAVLVVAMAAGLVLAIRPDTVSLSDEGSASALSEIGRAHV